MTAQDTWAICALRLVPLVITIGGVAIRGVVRTDLVGVWTEPDGCIAGLARLGSPRGLGV
ncbi:hypothetical protein Mpop_1204 [Methylorubrum populi BJ001]|uniref:Uncharacterized protein n=1 Tax=Methylorubrum populi (strain ATCC BAA-705 / NCIMB 13946 / BJ001) TaxID=441620 RepID=B1ZC33_METPB|nr:hypothetical protein Mpop_1204 [Methylorubrum populi BJ001]